MRDTEAMPKAWRDARGPLTVPQLEVLKLCAERPRITTKTTHHGYVAGNVAAALARRGLLRWGHYDHEGEGFDGYAITSAGAKAIGVPWPTGGAEKRLDAEKVVAFDIETTSVRPGPTIVADGVTHEGPASLLPDALGAWRNESARKANKLHKDGRKPTVDVFRVVRAPGWPVLDCDLTVEAVTLEVALERTRLDALANPDCDTWRITRTKAKR